MARASARQNMRRARIAYDRATLRARVAERRYSRDLAAIVERIASRYQDFLGKAIVKVSERTDARASGNAKADLKKLRGSLTQEIAPDVTLAFGRMYTATKKASEQAATTIGIPIRSLGPSVEAAYEKTLAYNISLVEDASREYADQVAEIFGDPDNFGRRVEDLAAELEERGSVVGSRAELIARDQTLKVLAGLNESRHKAAGIDRYRWSSSLDESVRETHKENEGKIFSYDDPPEETGNPGDDVQCRCAAIPILDDLEELDPDEEAASE